MFPPTRIIELLLQHPMSDHSASCGSVIFPSALSGSSQRCCWQVHAAVGNPLVPGAGEGLHAALARWDSWELGHLCKLIYVPERGIATTWALSSVSYVRL